MINQLLAKSKWFLADVQFYQVAVVFLLLGVGVFLYLLYIKKEKPKKSIIYALLFSLSMTLIIMFTLLGRSYDKPVTAESMVLSLRLIFQSDAESIIVFMFNILLFVPLGIVLKYRKSFVFIFVSSTVLTLVIESIQLFFKKGLFEVSDLIGNVLGAMLGALIFVGVTYVIAWLGKLYQKYEIGSKLNVKCFGRNSKKHIDKERSDP